MMEPTRSISISITSNLACSRPQIRFAQCAHNIAPKRQTGRAGYSVTQCQKISGQARRILPGRACRSFGKEANQSRCQSH